MSLVVFVSRLEDKSSSEEKQIADAKRRFYRDSTSATVPHLLSCSKSHGEGCHARPEPPVSFCRQS